MNSRPCRLDVWRLSGRSHLILGTALCVLTLSGCAHVTHEKVKYHPYPANEQDAEEWRKVRAMNAQEDERHTGVRYYLSSPYLLVYGDGKGNLVWKIYNLPDQTKLMVATPKQVFAKATANLTFANGVLTTSHTETDSSVAVKSVIGAIEKAFSPRASAESREPLSIPPPQLYKIVVDQDSLILVGTQSNTPIKVSLKPGK